MADERISAQVILRTSDNIAANYCTNTFHFLIDFATVDPTPGADDRDGITDQVADALVTLYNGLAPRMAGLQVTGHRIKFVNIDDPAPQFPYRERVFSITGTIGGSQLPSEVAIVSSFEATQVSGVNQATRRGRVYIGPISTSSNDDGRVGDSTRTAISDAFEGFANDQDQAGFTGWQWMIYSRTRDEMSRVVMGHIDNAFDTQRRRGVQSTIRSVWNES